MGASYGILSRMSHLIAPSLADLVDEAEVADLFARFGPGDRRELVIDMTPNTFAEWWEALVERPNRRGEVVLVMQRPNRHVLLHTKVDYPPMTYRLPTGGVHPGEAVLDALHREAAEETGLAVEVRRCLGVIGYEFRCRADERRVAFASYVFLAGVDYSEPAVQDPEEDIMDFLFVHPDRLPDFARSLRRMAPDWRDWGRFRAHGHDLAAEGLRGRRR